MALAILIGVVWLLVVAAVLVLCRAAQRGDAELRAPSGVPADVVPLVIARRTVARHDAPRRSAPAG